MAKKTKDKVTDGESAEAKILRLQAANIQLKLLNLRQQQAAIDKEAKMLLHLFQDMYADLKKARNVPEGQEVNLETGELFTPPSKDAP